MKRVFLCRLLTFSLLCICICVCARIHTDKQDVSISIPFAKTVLLEQNEEYASDMIADRVAKSGYYQCTLEDSSLSITDTLRGRCWYQLYFDTNSLALGQELRRTKDSLVAVGGINRAINSYRFGDIENAPHEILVADSLIRDAIKNKRIWLEYFATHYVPYHSLVVDFTIVPILRKNDHKDYPTKE